MEPFTLALAALSAVKQGIALYKDAKSTGSEVIEITRELSTSLGSFFDHQEQAIKQDEKTKKNPPKGKSLQAIALENVLRRKQLEQAEAELRELLVYQSPPELGAVWTEFEKEREKLKKEQKIQDELLKKKRRLTKEKITNGWRDGILELQSALQFWWSPLLLLD